MKKPEDALLLLSLYGGVAVAAETSATAPTGIAIFNRALTAATAHMDNAATAALWDEHGVRLVPPTKPIIGRNAIAWFMDDVRASLPGVRMAIFDMTCFEIAASGEWASEWCQEHQIVALTDGIPP